MRAAVDYGEADQGDVKKETVVGNACGGKLGSHGSKANAVDRYIQHNFLLKKNIFIKTVIKT